MNSTLSTLAQDGLRKPEIVTLVIQISERPAIHYRAKCNGHTSTSTTSREEAAKRVAIRAAASLRVLGVIRDIPDPDQITLRELTPFTFHVHLGPCALGTTPFRPDMQSATCRLGAPAVVSRPAGTFSEK